MNGNKIGRNPKTKDWFIKKAKSVHTDENGYCKYDYSIVDYKNTKSKVEIICKEDGHGAFTIAAYSHLRGSGCAKCNTGGRKPKTVEWFIEKSNSVHGYGSYDYSRVDYKNNRDKVLIGCKNGHGYFYQSPSSHMKGLGCRVCGVESRLMTKEEFIEKAKKVHGSDRYTYTGSIVVGRKTSTEIFCNTCEKIFTQIIDNHLCGSGCPNCAFKSRLKARRSTAEKFIKKAKEIHGSNLYDYSQVEYINNRTKVKIKCIVHNETFEQTPNAHLLGQGCRKCAYLRNGERRRKDLHEFIDQARLIHGLKFDYSKVEYKSAHKPVLIICEKGHENYQTPANHLSGAGCWECKNAERQGIYSFCSAENSPEKYQKDCIFYNVEFTNKKTGNVFRKIGITTRSVDERFSQANKYFFEYRIISETKGTLFDCMELEEFILSEMRDSGMLYKVHDLRNTPISGWSESYYPKTWYN